MSITQNYIHSQILIYFVHFGTDYKGSFFNFSWISSQCPQFTFCPCVNSKSVSCEARNRRKKKDKNFHAVKGDKYLLKCVFFGEKQHVILKFNLGS